MSSMVAMLGASPKEERYSHKAQRLLMEGGYMVVPIAPAAEEILGVACLRSIQECSSDLDTLTVYIGPERLSPMSDEIIEACTLALLSTGQF